MHETIAPYLLGQDPEDRLARRPALRLPSATKQAGPGLGATRRGDIAFWDIFGKATGSPSTNFWREEPRGHQDLQHLRGLPLRARGPPGGGQRGLPEETAEATRGPTKTSTPSSTRADELGRACSRKDHGMKMCRLIPTPKASGGHYISDADLHKVSNRFAIRETWA